MRAKVRWVRVGCWLPVHFLWFSLPPTVLLSRAAEFRALKINYDTCRTKPQWWAPGRGTGADPITKDHRRGCLVHHTLTGPQEDEIREGAAGVNTDAQFNVVLF